MTCNATVLSQLLQSVPRLHFQKLVQSHDGQRRSDALPRWTQFVGLVVGHLGQRHSLRDIEAALAADPKLHYHLNIDPPSRASLARANEQLSADFYRDLFGLLYAQVQSAPVMPGKKKFRFKHKLFSLDGSLIDLSMKVFPWADVSSKKAAFKLHLGLDHDGLIPAFAEVTEGLTSEMDTASGFDYPPGSVLVFDRGYSRYTWHKELTDKGLFWVTRARRGIKYEVIEERPVPEASAIISDQIVRLSSKQARRDELYDIRMIKYRDPDSGRVLSFITNQMQWVTQTIADIYKARWEVELFFKWIKQHLKIKTVIGHSINAVASQIFVALCVYLLNAYQRYLSRTAYGLTQVFHLLQLNLFTRKSVIELLCPRKRPPPDPQFSLSLRRTA